MEKNQEQRAVKGTMVTDIVKTIRSMKDKPWDKYLSDEAKELVFNERILASAWYPFEPVLSCLLAAYKILAQGKPDLAREWGRINVRRLLETIYKNVIVPGDILSTLKKFEIVATNSFIQNLPYEVKEMGGKHGQVKIFEDDPRTEPIFYVVAGALEALIEMAGAKNGQVKILERHWEGAGATVFDVHWD